MEPKKGTFSAIGGSIELPEVRKTVDAAESVPFTFDGVIEGDSLSGVLYFGEYRSANFIAKRPEFKNLLII